MDHPIAIQLLKYLHQGDSNAITWLLRNRLIDFEALNAFLRQQQMAVYFFSTVDAMDLSAHFPENFIKPVEAQYNMQVQRNARFLAILDEIRREFSTADIPFILLKGLYFSTRYAGGLNRRFVWDIDILIHRHDIDPVNRVLTAMGFAVTNATFAGLHRYAQRIQHALEYQRAGIGLDLHWCIRKRPSYRIDYKKLWESKTGYSIQDADYYVLSDEYNLILLILGLAHDIERSHCKLRHYWDLYSVLCDAASSIDWTRFFGNREQEGLLKISVNLLMMMFCLLDCEQEFPQIKKAIEPFGDLVCIKNRCRAGEIFRRPRQSLRNKILFSQLIDLPTWRYWLWWVATLPLRYLLGRSI